MAIKLFQASRHWHWQYKLSMLIMALKKGSSFCWDAPPTFFLVLAKGQFIISYVFKWSKKNVWRLIDIFFYRVLWSVVECFGVLAFGYLPLDWRTKMSSGHCFWWWLLEWCRLVAKYTSNYFNDGQIGKRNAFSVKLPPNVAC